jgi:hypothetical protein
MNDNIPAGFDENGTRSGNGEWNDDEVETKFDVVEEGQEWIDRVGFKIRILYKRRKSLIAQHLSNGRKFGITEKEFNFSSWNLKKT